MNRFGYLKRKLVVISIIQAVKAVISRKISRGRHTESLSSHAVEFQVIRGFFYI